MKTYSLQSRHKAFLFTFLFALALLVFIFNTPYIFSRAFSQLKKDIEQGIGDALDRKVTIEHIGIFPYGALMLDKVNIYDERSKPCVNVTKCHVRFRLLSLLKDKTVIVSKVRLLKPVFLPSARNLKVIEEKKEIRGKYKLKLSKHAVIKATSASVLFDENNPSDRLGFSFSAAIKEDRRVYSEGWIDLREWDFKNYVLKNILFFGFADRIKYKLRSSLTADTLYVEELLLDFGQFKVNAIGRIENYDTDPILNLKLSLKELTVPEGAPLKSKLFITNIRNVIVQIKDAFREPRWFVRLDKLKSKPPYLPTTIVIDNFYCNLKFSKDKFLIENLSCFLNNFPIGLKCKLTDFKTPYIELDLVSYPGQLPSLKRLNPLNFAFYFSGRKYEDSVRGKTSFEIERLVPSSKPRKSHRIKIISDDLSWKFSPYLSIQAKDIIYEANIPKPDMKWEFTDFTSLLHQEGDKIYFTDLSLMGYEGFLQGNGFLESRILPPRFFLNFEFTNFNTAELVKALRLDFDLIGNLNGKGIIDTATPSLLLGRAIIFDGYIKDVKLLDLVSDFLSIEPLRDIHFESFSSNFSFSAAMDEIFLNKIKLHSKDIYFDGNFRIGDKQKINGDMLVKLSVNILKESPKLKLLFFLMGERLRYADFEFKIGGLAKTPHIQWLDTKFKKNLMRYLSKKGRETLESEIEKAIEPLIGNE